MSESLFLLLWSLSFNSETIQARAELEIELFRINPDRILTIFLAESFNSSKYSHQLVLIVIELFHLSPFLVLCGDLLTLMWQNIKFNELRRSLQ